MRTSGYFSPKPRSLMRTTILETPASSLTLTYVISLIIPYSVINILIIGRGLPIHSRLPRGHVGATDKQTKVPSARSTYETPHKLEGFFFTHHLYPYHDFPTIKSHVHSRFIICNSGSKLKDDLFSWGKAYETRKDDLTKVQVIWNSWKHAAPTGEFVKKTSEGGDADIKDDNSQKTTVGPSLS